MIQIQNKQDTNIKQKLNKYWTNNTQILYKYKTIDKKLDKEIIGTHQGVSQLWVRVRARTPSLWKMYNIRKYEQRMRNISERNL